MTLHLPRPAVWRKTVSSLAARLLLLTCAFVFFAEVLTFVPLIGHRHRELLQDKIQAAESAILPFSELQWGDLDVAQRRMLLDRLDADAVVLYGVDYKEFYPVVRRSPKVDFTVNLAADTAFGPMIDGLDCLFAGGSRTLLVQSTSHIKSARRIAVILDETTIRSALVDYAMNIFGFGMIVLVLSAAMLYFSLYRVLVAPMRHIIKTMAAFRQNPEAAARIVAPSSAVGEIGQAERELAAMQRDLLAYLQQTARLAALGAAVARIQHDLRNILATAQLTTDRLASSRDPAVQKSAHGLMGAIDRANRLASSTLKYVRSQEHPPQPSRFAVAPLIDEIVQSFVGVDFRVEIAVAPDLTVSADRDHLFRAVLNLMRNAADALAGRSDGTVAVVARKTGAFVEIDIVDDGPGIADATRAKLFQPFALSSDHGSGLGLAIARELMRSNGGDVVLAASGTEGSRFRITLPIG